MPWSDALSLASAATAPRPARISRQDTWQPLAVMSFDGPQAPQKTKAELEAEAAARAEQELARQLEASWQAGHEAGVAEADARHREEERQHGMTVRARAGALLADFDAGLKALHEGLADEVLTLALTLAERIACEQIRLSREALAPVLAESVKHISERARHVEVTVNPADVDVAQQWFAANHPEITVRVLAAGRVSRGGCTLAAGSTRVDGQLETRVARAFAALGHSRDARPGRETQGRAGDVPAAAAPDMASHEPAAAGQEAIPETGDSTDALDRAAHAPVAADAETIPGTGGSTDTPRTASRKRRIGAQAPTSPARDRPTEPSATG